MQDTTRYDRVAEVRARMPPSYQLEQRRNAAAYFQLHAPALHADLASDSEVRRGAALRLALTGLIPTIINYGAQA